MSGDTLFVGACGRCDLPGGDAAKLWESLQRLKGLPQETVLYPGHDYGDVVSRTMSEEARLNPYLKVAEREAFLELREGRKRVL